MGQFHIFICFSVLLSCECVVHVQNGTIVMADLRRLSQVKMFQPRNQKKQRKNCFQPPLFQITEVQGFIHFRNLQTLVASDVNGRYSLPNTCGLIQYSCSHQRRETMDKLVCLQDFEVEALERLDKNAGDYFKSGSDDEITLTQNFEAYTRWLIRPRMLRNVSKRILQKSVQGKPVQFPIGFSPAGFQGLAHCDGEIASAWAARTLGTIFVLSTYATRSIEEIAEACPGGRNWFQLFPNSSPDVSRDLVQRAERAGFEAIVVTLDAQHFGNKRQVARTGLNFPPQLRLANFANYIKANEDVNDISGHVHRSLAKNLTWDIVPFLRKCTNLPLILKGILRTEDAELAVKHNVDGIWISNHGGRQIDTAVNTIDVLSEISSAVKGKCEIYIDSGIRRGTDVFKALALGATMTFVGRPQIWGIAVNGEKGATRVLEILKEELDLTMALSGVADINKVTKEYVCRSHAVAKL